MLADKNIEGKHLHDLFDKLIREQILIKVSLPKTDFESLTVLTDTIWDNPTNLFQIDMPEGLISAMHNTKAEMMSFEFTGAGHLTHRFEAAFHDISENSIWLKSPAVVQRYQMRNNFRIKVHPDSYAILKIDGTPVRMDMENLSVGGVFCYCPNVHKPLLLAESKLENMALNVTARQDCFIIQIDQALVKRVEPWLKPKHFGVAFEFVQIQRTTRQQLIRHIYKLQRDFLQGRLKMGK